MIPNGAVHACLAPCACRSHHSRSVAEDSCPLMANSHHRVRKLEARDKRPHVHRVWLANTSSSYLPPALFSTAPPSGTSPQTMYLPEYFTLLESGVYICLLISWTSAWAIVKAYFSLTLRASSTFFSVVLWVSRASSSSIAHSTSYSSA